VKRKNENWDVIVIGGGPAGMMAAGRAGEVGKRALLLEKNESLGKKLRITGGGRCNVTNAEFDTRTFLSNFKESDKFLHSPFSQFGVKEALEFFHSKGMPTKIEDRKRVFPESDSAESVWNVFIDYLKKHNVDVWLKSEVKAIHEKNGKIESIELKNGRTVKAKSYILATGGKSRPETGSTGDGFKWLKDLSHAVAEPKASLVPLIIKEPFVKDLQGITLPEVKISVYLNGEKQQIFKKETAALKKSGRLLFTHFGVSGPLILNIAKHIGEMLEYGEVKLKVDIVPSLPHDALNQKLQTIFKIENKKKIKNSLNEIVPSGFIETLLKTADINPDTENNSVTREMRVRLMDVLKAFTLTVGGLMGTDKAIVTSGGVELSEIDFKTMRSKKIENLFLIGDVLNIDRPSGGFSLQLCWTTGFIAGSNA